MLVLVSTFVFSLAGVFAKIAVNDFHVLQMLFFRQAIFLLSSLLKIRKDFPHSLKTEHSLIHITRLASALIILSCGVWAVAVISLNIAITLGFAQIFGVTGGHAALK